MMRITGTVYMMALLLCVLVVSCKSKTTTTTATNRLPYYNTADFTPVWISENEVVPTDMHRIPSFSFINQDGDTITRQSVEGKIYVTDFFFTSCGGICPKLTKNLKVIQDTFALDPELIILSHSVTPDHDSIATLKKYALNNGVISKKWHLLTGNRDSIYNIARKSYFADEDLGLQKNNSDFLHTENILLLDRHQHIRGIYKGTAPAEMNNLIADIRALKNTRE